ncbi:hypothetical protein IU11_14030 [Cellulosimicrobium sp. MM]|nr:hypothetical protein [Cellulosimicrobium sp. MM]KFD43156.1 hypothetical protein IU11_14030 [Cellulosimicrobium sp. MM]
MALTDPYRADVLAQLSQPLQHVHRVYAYAPSIGEGSRLDLDLITATLEYDEDRAPHVVFNGSIQVPESQSDLDFLDPRKNRRLVVEVGYVYSDGYEDVHKVADLGLRERVTRRPQNDVTILAASDEAVIQDHRYTSSNGWAAGSSVQGAIFTLLWQIVGMDYPIDRSLSSERVLAGEYELAAGDDPWNAIQNLADQGDAWVYHDGMGTFHIVAQPKDAGAAAATFTVGREGTITASEVALDRQEFANFIVVEYEYEDSTGATVVNRGWAEVTSGDYGTASVGRVARTVRLAMKGTTTAARVAANSMLWRTVSRGRRMHIEVAAATYWLRPGMTVTVKLPTGPQERHLVKSVTFNLPSGSMSVHTRLPENVNITTGE